MRFISSKHSILSRTIKLICDNLIDKNFPLETKIILSQCLKNSQKKWGEVDISIITKILRLNDNEALKSEVNYSLEYAIKNKCLIIDQKLYEEIKEITNENVAIEAKNFLEVLSEKHLISSHRKSNLRRLRINERFSNQDYKGPKAIVTKNQQRIKVNYKNSLSEQSAVNI